MTPEITPEKELDNLITQLGVLYMQSTERFKALEAAFGQIYQIAEDTLKPYPESLLLNKKIKDLCREHGLDPYRFISVPNFSRGAIENMIIYLRGLLKKEKDIISEYEA